MTVGSSAPQPESRRGASRLRIAALAMGLAGVALLGAGVLAPWEPRPPARMDPPVASAVASQRPALRDPAFVASIVAAALRREPAVPHAADPYLSAPAEPVYAALRAGRERYYASGAERQLAARRRILGAQAKYF